MPLQILCQEILREYSSLKRAQDYKSVDFWFMIVMNMNEGSIQKSIRKIFKRKIIDGCIPRDIINHCIRGHAKLAQVMAKI